MEAKLLTPEKKIKLWRSVVDALNEWIASERPKFSSFEAHDEMMDDALINPDDEHATELGEVPHEEGSILQKNLFAPYLYGRYTYR